MPQPPNKVWLGSQPQPAAIKAQLFACSHRAGEMTPPYPAYHNSPVPTPDKLLQQSMQQYSTTEVRTTLKPILTPVRSAQLDPSMDETSQDLSCKCQVLSRDRVQNAILDQKLIHSARCSGSLNVRRHQHIVNDVNLGLCGLQIGGGDSSWTIAASRHNLNAAAAGVDLRAMAGPFIGRRYA